MPRRLLWTSGKNCLLDVTRICYTEIVKIKVVLGILIVIALALLSRLFVFFGNSLQTATIGTTTGAIAQRSSSGTVSYYDQDSDGLPGTGEAQYNTDPVRADTDDDGYLDGEEVMANCNPQKKAPGDCKRSNLTMDVGRIVIGALQSGDLAANVDGALTENQMATLSDLILGKFDSNFIRTAPHPLAVLTGNPQEQVPAYLVQVRQALAPSLLQPKSKLKTLFTKALTKVFKEDGSANEELLQLQQNFSSSATALTAVAVPAAWESWHTQLVNTVYSLSQNLKVLGNNNDPMSQALGIQKLQTNLEDAVALMEQFTKAQKVIVPHINAAVDENGFEIFSGLETPRGAGDAGSTDGTGDGSGSGSDLGSGSGLLPGAGSLNPESIFALLDGCGLTGCVPVHVKKDDPFEAKVHADHEERKRAREELKKLMQAYQDMIQKGGVSVMGKQGVPTFIQNWRDYKRDSQDEGAEIGRIIVGEALFGTVERPERAVACPYLVDAVAKGLNVHQPTELDVIKVPGYRVGSEYQFHELARCTLPENFNYEKYLSGEEFSWEVHHELITNPANTPQGLFALGAEQIELQRATEEEINQNEVQANDGSRGLRNEHGVITVPGSVASDTNSALVKTTLEWIISSDEGGELGVSAIPLGGALGGCGGLSFPQQLLSSFLKQFTGSALCDFLGLIKSVSDIINRLPL